MARLLRLYWWLHISVVEPVQCFLGWHDWMETAQDVTYHRGRVCRRCFKKERFMP